MTSVQHADIDHTGITGVGGTLTVEDEGTPLATGATTLDFVGAGVTASGTGADKTITIPGASAPNCKQTVLASDVTIPSANTVQDVLSLSLEAGDWLVYGQASVTSANAGQTQLTIAIHDGTSIVSDAQVVQQSGIGGITQTAFVIARITLAGTTTVKLQAFSVRGSSDSKVEDTNTSNGTADVGTRLVAIACTAV